MIPADTVNEQLTLMADTLDQTALTKQLATSLDGGLTSYTKDKMIEIAEHAGYSVKKSHTKSRMAEDIAAQMEQSFREELSYMAKQELAVLTQLMDGPIEGNALEVFLPYSFSLDAIQRGWVFLFKEKDHYTLVLPDEISQWMAVLMDDNDFNTQSEQNQSVFEHVTALIHLYGVFNAQVAWSAWEKRTNTPAIEQDTFFNVTERMQGKLEKYAKAGELLYSAQHLNAEDAQKLHDGRTVSGYYLPSESDILFYAINEVDSRTNAYAKLKAYLHQKYPEKQEMVTHLLHEIGMNAVMDNRIQELIQYLDETMNFTFDNADEFQEFSSLYANLSSETRKWQLKGHTPNELREAQQRARSRQRTRNAAPVKQQPVRVNKVGRNEPCPCGSGKKYKKCHGR